MPREAARICFTSFWINKALKLCLEGVQAEIVLHLSELTKLSNVYGCNVVEGKFYIFLN